MEGSPFSWLAPARGNVLASQPSGKLSTKRA
jgi:hypothetical protein